MSRNLIVDGQTRQAYVAPLDDATGMVPLYEPMTITFRPMLAEDTEVMTQAINQATPRKQVEIVAANLASRITAWSEVDPDNKPIPITVENLRRLPLPLLSRLRAIVGGTGAASAPLGGVSKPSGEGDVDAYLDELNAKAGAATGAAAG